MEDKPKPGDWLTIVGIVSDVKQRSLTDSRFVVQTRKNPTDMPSGIRAVLRKVDQELPAQSVTTMEPSSRTITEAQSQTRLFGLFSIMALMLAAVGIFGVLACSVAERTHEIGIRMAMGAERKDILSMVIRRILALTGSGVLIGAIGALAATRVLTKLPAQRAARVYPLVALRHE